MLQSGVSGSMIHAHGSVSGGTIKQVSLSLSLSLSLCVRRTAEKLAKHERESKAERHSWYNSPASPC